MQFENAGGIRLAYETRLMADSQGLYYKPPSGWFASKSEQLQLITAPFGPLAIRLAPQEVFIP